MVSHVDSIASIRAFVAAAEAGSFKQGGLSLGLTSSAVGKAITRLEDQMAVQLFHRTTRTLSLSEPGTLFLLHAKRILQQLEEAEAELQSSATELRGSLRVGLPLSAGVFGEPLAEFSQRYPCIQLELEFSDRMVDVIAEGFGVVVRTGDQPDSRLMQQKLGEFTWCLAASPGYLERAGTPKGYEDLTNHVCLRQRLSTGRIAPWPLASDDGVIIPTSHSADIIDPLLDMALSDAGIASFPTFIARRHFEKGRLIEVLPGKMQRAGVMNLLWPSGKYQTPKTRVFIDLMIHWARAVLHS